MEDVLDAREAAVYLRINEQTLRRLARDGALPAFKVGRIWRFRKEVLDEWADRQVSTAGEEISARATAAASGGPVLVVDDHEHIHEFLRDVLQEVGLEVISAFRGEEALELLRTHSPELVFLDLRMPGMNGAETLREMRKTHPTLSVVILTGYPDSEMMNEALKYSPVTLLSKPCTHAQVLNTVQSLLLIT